MFESRASAKPLRLLVFLYKDTQFKSHFTRIAFLYIFHKFCFSISFYGAKATQI